MLLNAVFACLALVSLGLMLWQWIVARRFPLHQRASKTTFAPAVTLLKPLKGCDATTEASLRSWFVQQYQAPVQILFGVASADDPVCPVVRRLIEEHPATDAHLVICGPLRGTNSKVSKLIDLEALARHELLVISDADVRVPPDFLANFLAPLRVPVVGLVNCFYRLANPATLAMRWEAVAVNADFWSQVLQAQSLRPLDFALGAVMAMRWRLLGQIGGFTALVDCLADDYQLGNRLARQGSKLALSPVVVECWSEPMGWREVWKHQLRWARTIRVCQPVPYFFSILSNPTLWPLLWAAVSPGLTSVVFCAGCWLVRVGAAWDLQQRLARGRVGFSAGLLALLKDLLQTPIWVLAFLGNRVEWRGQRMQLRRDGTLVKI